MKRAVIILGAVDLVYRYAGPRTLLRRSMGIGVPSPNRRDMRGSLRYADVEPARSGLAAPPAA